MSSSQPFTSPIPSIPEVIISSPRRHVLLVTFNRPKQLNAMRREMHYQLEKLFAWYDAQPSLRCCVLTGKGRAFCAGADLKEWHDKNKDETSGSSSIMPATATAAPAAGAVGQDEEKWGRDGFGGMSNRKGKKPILIAVNGLCLGGGMEMVTNADLVVASSTAKFGLPEATKGVVAIAGALPRLTKVVGRQRATEMALLGRMYTADQMLQWGIVNKVVGAGTGQNAAEEAVVEEALKWAEELAGNSPDSIIVSRAGLLGGWEAEDPRKSTWRVDEEVYPGMDKGENMREGVFSFVERRKPVWKDSKL